MVFSTLALLLSSLTCTFNGVDVPKDTSINNANGCKWISTEIVEDFYIDLHFEIIPVRFCQQSSYYDGGFSLWFDYTDNNVSHTYEFLNIYSWHTDSNEYLVGYCWDLENQNGVNLSYYFNFYKDFHTGGVSNYLYSQKVYLYTGYSFDYEIDIDSSSRWYDTFGGSGVNVNDTRPFTIRIELMDSYTYSTIVDGMGNDYQQGYDNGYSQGYSNGESNGYTNGYQVGKDEWYQKGQDLGYGIGYQAGLQDGTNNNYGFPSLFYSIADTPVLMIQRLFNFDLFGMNVLTVVLSLFTAILLIHIAKKIIK